MKRLVSILALFVATLYVGETNGDEPQASSPLNWGKQEWQKPKPTPPANTPRRQFSAVSGGSQSQPQSVRYQRVYYYNQFGNRSYYYRPVYNTNIYIRNYNRSQQYNGRYFGNFLFGGWR